jgi:hypothetical protein
MNMCKATTHEDRAELKVWLSNAFDTNSNNLDDTDRAASDALKTEFIRLVWEPAWTLLRQDLVLLMKLDCTALNVLQLLLVPITFHSPAMDDLARAGITTYKLRDLRTALKWMPDVINKLVQADSGPLCMLPDCFPNKKQQRRVRHSIDGIPEALTFLAALMENYPPKLESGLEKLAECRMLLILYLLLTHYGNGAPTLSRLVQAMRQAVQTALPQANYLARTKSLKAPALEKGLLRFCRDYPTEKLQADMLVAYFTSNVINRKRIGLLEFMEKQVKSGETESLEGRAESLAEALQLTEQQRRDLVCIFGEEDDRIAQSFIDLTSRRTDEPIFPNALLNKQAGKKLIEVGEHVVEQTRRILNPAQRQQYEVFLKEQEAAFAREMAKMPDPSR